MRFGYLHPADVLDNLDIVQSCFFQLQKFGGLHQVFELQGAFRHVVTLAPFFDPCNVVVDLETTLPREEVSTHEQIVEGCHADKSQQFGNGLRNDGVLEVESLHRLEDVVEER